MRQPKKYEKDGCIAVLYSPGFGSGWSTEGVNKTIAYDKRVINFYLKHKDDQEYMKALTEFSDNEIKQQAEEQFAKWGYYFVWFNGLRDAKIEWIPKGVQFRILSYDGDEYIERADEVNWVVA